MTKNKGFFNSIFRWQLGLTIYIGVIQLITLILLGRFLPFKELGAYAIFSIVFRFALYSLDPGMFFSIIQRHESSKVVVRKIFRLQFLYILIGILAFLFIAYLYKLNEIIGPVILLNSISIIVIIGIGAYIQSKLIQKFRQREIALSQMMAYTVELIFVLFMCKFFQPIEVFSSGVVLRLFIFYSVGSILLWKLGGLKETDALEAISAKVHMEQSKYNIWSQIISFVQGQYDTIVIVGLFGLSTLGKYILMTELSYMIFAKINPVFNKAIIPVVSKAFKEKEDVTLIIKESLTSFIYLMFTLYFVFWIYSRDWLTWAYPDKAYELFYFALYLIPIAFLKSVNNIVISYIVAFGESKKVFYWNIGILLFNYIALGLFYLLKGSLFSFLIFGVVYTFLSTLVLFILLKKLLKVHNISFSLNKSQLGLVIMLLSLGAYICKYLFSNIAISVIALLILVFILFYAFERERLKRWINLSII